MLSSIGNITRTVAVLVIHMLMVAEINMKPPTRVAGLVPTSRNIVKAKRRCKCHRSSANARINPPRNRKIIGWA